MVISNSGSAEEAEGVLALRAQLDGLLTYLGLRKLPTLPATETIT